MKKIMLLLIVIIGYFGAGCSDNPTDSYSYPTIISGIVKNNAGSVVANARVTLTTITDFASIYTDANGIYRITGVTQAKHRIKFEGIGLITAEFDVPSAVNGTSTFNPVLAKYDVVIPSAKPLSKGKVRINNGKLETDFTGSGTYIPFVIKGAAFSISPIGGGTISTKLYDRGAEWLAGANANTARTYNGVDKYFLQRAAANNLRVIVGFWVDYGANLADVNVRTTIKTNFSKFVFDLKDSPGLLMWTLGNEQNYQNGNKIEWYTLVQELCKLAYEIEGENYHPIGANNGGFANIGNPNFATHDSTLNYMDYWGVNLYDQNLTNQFKNYRNLSKKPVVLTEWGIDALDNRYKTEYESVQAQVDSTNWAQIRLASDVCLGGTVFEFTDEWWKDTNANTHDYGGYATGAHPDGYSNEEWWGLISLSPDSNGDGLDEWRGRLAYYMFQRNWK